MQTKSALKSDGGVGERNHWLASVRCDWLVYGANACAFDFIRKSR